ncbi:MAG: twin-arginine translocation signal domain-containing protein, partial [Rhodospirillaceae bacterium]|nr:twin-arginine translocation signal domain-containing protein [Rhodospirillaceae bacterium]
MTVKKGKTSNGALSKISRRKFMGTAASVAAAGTITGFPNIVQAADPIRTIGLGVSIINEIQAKAAKDVGFGIRGQALGYGALFGKTLNQNDQYE